MLLYDSAGSLVCPFVSAFRLALLAVHRRIHYMKVERVIFEMAERRPVLAEA